MRGALDEKVDEVYRFYTVPASKHCFVGHIILENHKKANKSAKPAAKPRCRELQRRT